MRARTLPVHGTLNVRYSSPIMKNPFQPLQPCHAGARRGPCRPFVAVALTLVLLAGTGGCAYRITIQQGNFLEEDTIEQVEIGMTRQQVQFLLGTPMIQDPFHAERWDYLYYVIYGRRRRVRQGHFIVYFENDRVSTVERFTESGA